MIRKVLTDMLMLCIAVLVAMAIHWSCNQKKQNPQVRYIIKDRIIKSDPETVTITKVKERTYTFVKHDSAATITGTIISPCDPETVTIAYQVVDHCTTAVELPPVTSKAHRWKISTQAGIHSISAGLLIPIRNNYIGLQYDFVNRSPLISYCWSIGSSPKK